MHERPPATAEALKQGEQWYDVLRHRDQFIQTLKASVRVRVSHGIFSRAVDQALIVKRPADLRMDSFTVVGDLVHQFILHDGTLWVYDVKSGRSESNKDIEKLLEKNLGLALSIDDVISILVGSVPLETRGNYLAMKRKQGDVLWGSQSQILINPKTGLPQRYLGYTQYDERYEVNYSEYRLVEDVSFPHRIRVMLSEPRISLEISFKDIDINSSVSDDKFIYERH